MPPSEITPRDALIRLGASTAAAVANVLEVFVPGAVERGEVTAIAEGATPFANLPPSAVVASVHYVDGVTGANLFVMTPAGARALAVAMGAESPEDQTPTPELSELQMSAIGEAANQMLAAAAAAISVVLGEEVGISPSDTRILTESSDPTELFGKSPHACSTSFTVSGEPCRLIQLVPSAFVVRMARAFDELGEGSAEGAGGQNAELGARGDSGPMSLTDALRGVDVRVWAELGRTQLGLGQALELPIGAVVDLDRPAEAPLDLFVNGLCFGHGHLLVTGDGEWAIQVESLATPAARKPAPAPAPSIA